MIVPIMVGEQLMPSMDEATTCYSHKQIYFPLASYKEWLGNLKPWKRVFYDKKAGLYIYLMSWYYDVNKIRLD